MARRNRTNVFKNSKTMISKKIVFLLLHSPFKLGYFYFPHFVARSKATEVFTCILSVNLHRCTQSHGREKRTVSLLSQAPPFKVQWKMQQEDAAKWKIVKNAIFLNEPLTHVHDKRQIDGGRGIGGTPRRISRVSDSDRCRLRSSG